VPLAERPRNENHLHRGTRHRPGHCQGRSARPTARSAGIHILRLILSGTFEKFPALQVISGHWGEMVPCRLPGAAPAERERPGCEAECGGNGAEVDNPSKRGRAGFGGVRDERQPLCSQPYQSWLVVLSAVCWPLGNFGLPGRRDGAVPATVGVMKLANQLQVMKRASSGRPASTPRSHNWTHHRCRTR
jgi:hypothetical protein